MKEVVGDIWDYHAKGYWIVIPTNGSVKRDGCAVMGRGLAKEAAIRFPSLPSELGRLLNPKLKWGNIVWWWERYKLFTFPVKKTWAERASLSLIEESCQELVYAVKAMGIQEVYLPRVGCGNGRLNWADVKPILEKHLDDRFVVVEKKQGGY